MQLPLPLPPLSSQQVLFGDKEGDQGVCKFVGKPHGTAKCANRETNGQGESVTIDPAIGRVDYAGSSSRSSWNIFGRAVPGVGGSNGDGRLNGINED